MTIDEAIERERRKAKEQRKDNENCEYKAEYGCKGCADYYFNSCIECAEEHEQLAEWLEELKALKNGLNIKCDSLNEALEKGKKIGYNKAIDDFVKEIKEEIKVDKNGFNSYYEVQCIDVLEVLKIAEQLKSGD